MVANRTLRILVTDDHDDSLAMMAHLLRVEGHAVHSAPTASRAEYLASHYEYDLVISNLGLADCVGEQLMRELKQTYGLRGLAVSRDTDPGHRRRAFDAGFDSFLPKPFEFSHLRDVIREVMAVTDTSTCYGAALDGAI